MNVKKADAVQVAGDPQTKTLILAFRLRCGVAKFELAPNLAANLIREMGLALSTAPLPEFRQAATVFSIREIEAVLHGQTPSLQLETEAGAKLLQSIDVAVARKLHRQLSAMLAHLDSLGSEQKH